MHFKTGRTAKGWSSALMTLLALGCLVNTSCQDEMGGKIEVFTEPIDNVSKVAIDGANATWVNGDEIRINNTTATVSVSSGTASISTSGIAGSNYYALYPSSLTATSPLTGSSTTITLPDVFHYRTSGGRQAIDMPMAAQSNGGSSLEFKHLTGALMVRITNSFGGEMTVNEIIVNSSNSQISGTRTVDLSSTAAITGQTYNDDPSLTEAQKQVKMLFETPMAIAADGVKDIIIPVAPVSSSNKFTVTVKALYGGTAYAFKNTQTSGGSLDRNQLGYVPISLSASGVHTYENLVSTVDEYNAMVSTVNAATSGSLTYTIDGTIDFGGATVTPMVLQSGVTLTLNGIYDATLKDMRVGEIVSGSDSYCGMIKASNNNDVTITGITVENADLSGVTNGNPLRIGAFLSHATGSVNLSNCKVKNATFPGAITNTSNSSSYIGGFLGYLNSNSVTSSNISNCEIMQDGSHNITVTTVWGNMVLYFGGLAGNTTITSGINISHCNVKVESVSITGNNRDKNVGGLIGCFYNYANSTPVSTISNCSVSNVAQSGNMTISINYTFDAGGLIGKFRSNVTYINHVELSNNIAHVSMNADIPNLNTGNVGAVIGHITDIADITNASASNNVDGGTISFSGGGTKNYGNSIANYVGIIGNKSGSPTFPSGGISTGTVTVTGN